MPRGLVWRKSRAGGPFVGVLLSLVEGKEGSGGEAVALLPRSQSSIMSPAGVAG